MTLTINAKSQGKTSLLIFTSCRDSPSYLASTETVCDLLLPVETTVHKKWLSAETVCVVLLPAETLAKSHGQLLQEAVYQAQQSAGSLNWWTCLYPVRTVSDATNKTGTSAMREGTILRTEPSRHLTS